MVVRIWLLIMDLMTLRKGIQTLLIFVVYKVNKMYALIINVDGLQDPESSDIDIVVSVDIDDPGDQVRGTFVLVGQT